MNIDWRLLRFCGTGLFHAVVLLGLAMIEFPASASVGSWLSNTMLPLSLCLALAAMSVMSLWIRRDRMIGMIGIHVGLLVSLVAPLSLAWWGWSLWHQGRPAPQYIPMFITAAFGAFAFTAMLRTRPPKEERKPAADTAQEPAPAEVKPKP